MRGQDLILWVFLYLEGYTPDLISRYDIISKQEVYNALNRLLDRGLIIKKSWISTNLLPMFKELNLKLLERALEVNQPPFLPVGHP